MMDLSSNFLPSPPATGTTKEPLKVLWATPVNRFDNVTPMSKNAAYAAGLRYERKAKKHLRELFPGELREGQWFAYRVEGDSRTRYCQPDAFVELSGGDLLILEIKAVHTADIYEQLVLRYAPVVAAAFGLGAPPLVCEMVRMYDPAKRLPVTPVFVEHPTYVRPGQFGVYSWRD